MEAGALDHTLPPPAAGLGVRPARDKGSDARRQAFARAMQRRDARTPVRNDVPAALLPVGTRPQGSSVADGAAHVDVLA